MEHLRNLVELFHDQHPQLKAREELFQHIETTLLPHLLRVVQKDDTLLADIELFPGIKVEWKGGDENWKKLHMAMIYSVLHGNPKEKFSKIMEAVKGMIPGGTAQADEMEKILADEDTQSSMGEILELIMNTRLMSIVGDVISSIQLADLDLNFDDPEKLMEMMRNPQENAALKEVMDRARMILEEKVKSGKINPKELQRDIENIRAKFQSSFGKFLNQAVMGEDGGNTTGNTAQQILSNHPDARRARMLARLQKKQQQKTRDTK
jgi:hypothetical protein